MTKPWNARLVDDLPPWPNDICDDGTPFEFSVAFDGKETRLRMLTESQQARIGPLSTWSAGLALGERLKREAQADLSRFNEISALFAPVAPFPTRFSLWHAAVLRQHGGNLFKAYLNPQILGAAAAPRLTEEALHRLGFSDAWKFLEPRVTRSKLESELRYFSVDLARPEAGRVKVYVAQSASAADVDQMIDGAANAVPGNASRWLGHLTGHKGPYRERPILTCFAFRAGSVAPDVTLHVPIRSYVADDAEALDKIRGLLSKDDAKKLTRIASTVARRPLNAGCGFITYASLSQRETTLAVNVYLAPELYAVAPSRIQTPLPPHSRSDSSRRIKIRPRINMDDLQRMIARRRELFAIQRRLVQFEAKPTTDQIRAVVLGMALHVIGLQDVLRLLQQHCKDVRLEPLFAALKFEDKRHGGYPAALERLVGSASVTSLFSGDYAVIRDVSFRVIAETLRTTSDHARLAIAQCLLITTGECLERTSEFLERTESGDELHFFRRIHEELESRNLSFASEARQLLSLLEISEAELPAVLNAVDTTFGAITTLANELEKKLSPFGETEIGSDHPAK